MEFIDHFYKSLAPASTSERSERLAFLFHVCLFGVEIIEKKPKKNTTTTKNVIA